MSAPPGPGIDRASVRGIIVLVVAVVVGAALLSRTGGEPFEVAGNGGDQGEDTTEESTAETTQTDPDGSTVPPDTLVEQPTTTLGDPRPPGEVSVLVVNASDGVPGAAGENQAAAGSAGYQTLPVQDAPSTDTTTVYFTEGYQADAAAVAEALGFPDAPIAPQLEPIIPEAAEANVTVQLGQDIAPG